MAFAFWLRWSWRDLRRRLFQVIAIAAIVALGSGLYAGLASTSMWRKKSLDTTFSRLAAHDIDVSATAGLSGPASRLLNAVRSSGGTGISAAASRLVADLPVRAGNDGRVPAAGVIVGVDVSQPVTIDRWRVTAGTSIGPTDANRDVVLLDEHFARAHHLPASGTVVIAGRPVRYTGTALEPEYLNTTTTFGATIQGAATRAVIYAPIALVQELAGLAGQANDVVVRVRAGDNVEQVAARLSAALPKSLPDLALTVTIRTSDPSTRALYDEISSEQSVFDVFAVLILAGAGFAAFNLTRRVVEAQRRDIGVAMSLGIPPAQIAIRPLIMAAEVAMAGVAFGVIAGFGIGVWVLSIIRAQDPMPYWQTPWQASLFLRAAALGVAIPVAGSAYPVWRAVRVAPTDALLPPHLRSRRHSWATAVLRRMRLPGGTMSQAPIRRITIAPARSVMTVLAVGLVLAPLLAALGATDSAKATVNTGTAVLSGAGSNEVLTNLTSYQPAASPTVSALANSTLVGSYALGLNTGGYLIEGAKTIGISISMVDLADPLVVPASLASQHVPPGGIVISAKAASDLRVGPGKPVVLRHPLRQGTSFRFVDTVLPVRAVVHSPYRFIAYMSLQDESVMGLQGIVNTASLVPAAGVSVDQLQRTIAALPGVAWALPAAALADTIRNVLSLVTGLFVILQIVIGLLAFLVAYNSTRVGSDERAREHATMMAYGVRVWRVVLIGVVESLLLGVVGVGVGIGIGVLVVHFVLSTVFPAAVPDLSVLQNIAASSYVITAVIGLAATASAPTLVARRLMTMNLPSTLRYVE